MPTANPRVELHDGQEIVAQIAFFVLPGLGSEKPTRLFHAIQRLHSILKSAYQPDRVRVTSSLHGAVVVAAAGKGPFFDLRDNLLSVIADLRAAGLPFRIGMAHGTAFWLTDSDGHGTVIGEPVNIAARLAYAPVNVGVLVDQSFVSGRGGYEPPGSCFVFAAKPVEITGKKHDRKFTCYPGENSGDGGSDLARFSCPDGRSPTPPIDAAAIAFDLPRFSAGGLPDLSHRFRDFVAQLRTELVRVGANRFYYSPGGDGAIIVLREPNARVDAVAMAARIDDYLARDDQRHHDPVGLRSRIGLHAGPVYLYENAEGVLRPTGRVCFIADKLAGDQAPGVIVYSEQLKDAASNNRPDKFDREFRWLGDANCSPDGNVRRFAAKASLPLPPPSPVNAKILGALQLLVDTADRGNFGVTLSAIFERQPKAARGSVDVAKLVETLRADGVVLEISRWLKRDADVAIDRTALKRFCAGVALLAVSPEWTEKINKLDDGIGLQIPEHDGEVLGGYEINLPYWLHAAATWEDGQQFDFDGLFAPNDRSRNEIVVSTAVLPRDPTVEAMQREFKEIVVRIVLPKRGADKGGSLERNYDDALRQMAASMKIGRGYWLTYESKRGPEEFCEHFKKLRLNSRSVVNLLCRTPALFLAIPYAIEITTYLHEIRAQPDGPTRT